MHAHTASHVSGRKDRCSQQLWCIMHHANGYQRLRTARRPAHGRRTRRNLQAEMRQLWHLVFPPSQAQSRLTRYHSKDLERACSPIDDNMALRLIATSENSCISVKLREQLPTQKGTIDSRCLKGACNGVTDENMAQYLHVWQQYVRVHESVVVASTSSARDTQPTAVSIAGS
jgi:hypothetical protein